MKKLFNVVLLSMIIIGCVPTVPTNSSSSQFASSTPLSEIEFLDISTFDADLSSSMKAALSTITVITLSPVTVNEIPERLEKWLAAVKEKGGSIDMEPKTRSITTVISVLFSLLDKYGSLFTGGQTTNFYDYAANYNVILSYQPSDGKVNAIKFIRK